MDRKDLKTRILIATMCGHWKQIAEEFGADLELDHVCQAENMDGPRGEKVRDQISVVLQNHRGRVLHAPFNELFPAAIDPMAREMAMKRLNQAAGLAIEAGVNKMVVHSGYVPFVYFKEWHIDRSVEFWQEFMSDKPEDFEICIENVLDDEPYMLAEIAERVGDRRVGLCYDVGHANIVGRNRNTNPADRPGTDDQDEWFTVMKPYLKHLHIHNNDGMADYHRAFYDGTLDIERILDRVLSECPEDTTVTAEILAGEESFYWLREKGYI